MEKNLDIRKPLYSEQFCKSLGPSLSRIRWMFHCISCFFVFLQIVSRGAWTVHAIKCVKRKKIVHFSCQSLNFSFKTRPRPFADRSFVRFFACAKVQAFLQYKKLHLSSTFFYHPVNTSLPKEEQRRLLSDWLFDFVVFSLLTARKLVNQDGCQSLRLLG